MAWTTRSCRSRLAWRSSRSVLPSSSDARANLAHRNLRAKAETARLAPRGLVVILISGLAILEDRELHRAGSEDGVEVGDRLVQRRVHLGDQRVAEGAGGGDAREVRDVFLERRVARRRPADTATSGVLALDEVVVADVA